MNEPELGEEIDPGIAFNPFPSSFWIRQDSNPQPLDCESSSQTTRPDLRPKGGGSVYVGQILRCDTHKRQVENNRS